MVIIVTPTLFIIDDRLGARAVLPAVRLGLEVMAGGFLWIGALALLRTRLMTSELQAGLRSLLIAAGMGKSHA